MAGSAIAADLPLKAPPAPAPTAFNWTGYYVGLNAGAAWGDNSTSCAFTPGIGTACDGIGFPSLKSSGGLLGAEIGADWQYQNLVLGAAADWSALDLHGSSYFPSVDPGKANQTGSRYDWLGTARGRLGFAAGQSLFYGTAGFAFARVSDTYLNEINTPSAGYFTTSGIRTGWTAGAGWEYAFNRNWAVKLEYLHVGLGRSNLDISSAFTSGNFLLGTPPGSAVLHYNNAFDLVRAGVDFRW
jgi:outer membrane immunogenic protein